MGPRTDDPLPVLEPMPSGPQDIDFNSILEIADMGGVNDAMDRLVSQGVSPEQAAQMLQSAGFDLPSTAQPEQVGGYEENLPQGTDQSVPQEPETRRAEPVRRSATGSRMDLSFIQRINDPNLSEEQARAEYEKLPPALRYVYDRTADFSYNNQGSDTPAQLDPRDAAGWLDEFYQMQGEQTKAQSQDPAKARESAQQAARLQGILGIMDTYSAAESDLDNLVGPAVGSWAANEWDKWNNPDRYAQRFELSSVTKNEVLEAAKFVKPLSNDERKFLEEMFPRRDDPPQVWRSYFRRSRDILSKGLPEQPQQQGPAPATAPSPQGAATPPPNLPPTRIDAVTGQTMQLIQNQQGRWVYRMATQQQSQPNVTGR